MKWEMNTDSHPKAHCQQCGQSPAETQFLLLSSILQHANVAALLTRPTYGCVNLVMHNTYVILCTHHTKTHELLFISYSQLTEHLPQAA